MAYYDQRSGQILLNEDDKLALLNFGVGLGFYQLEHNSVARKIDQGQGIWRYETPGDILFRDTRDTYGNKRN